MNSPASKPKTSSEAPAPEWLSAADCARRTGLTVKALRIYERQGFIKPPRSNNGWRRYGAAELARLNSIVILRALGLTLSQIRAVFTDAPPSLLRILQVHAESLKAKRDVTDRALSFVNAAVVRMRTQQSLTLDELCELIKRLESNRSVDMKTSSALTRELINENVTPEEERAWHTWWAEHPEDALATREYSKAIEGLNDETLRLRKENADPASPQMQDLMRRHMEIIARYGVRERTRRQLAWNPTVTRKWIGIGVKMRQAREHGEEVQKLVNAAMRVSPWGQAFREVMMTVREIMKTRSDPACVELDRPIGRIREICAEYGLGDALTLVLWRTVIGQVNRHAIPPDELFEAEWEFMERALKARGEEAPTS